MPPATADQPFRLTREPQLQSVATSGRLKPARPVSQLNYRGWHLHSLVSERVFERAQPAIVVGNHSMMIETESDSMVTGIRFGNTGAQDSLPRLTAACQKSIGDRADLAAPKTGGIASAK